MQFPNIALLGFVKFAFSLVYHHYSVFGLKFVSGHADQNLIIPLHRKRLRRVTRANNEDREKVIVTKSKTTTILKTSNLPSSAFKRETVSASTSLALSAQDDTRSKQFQSSTGSENKGSRSSQSKSAKIESILANSPFSRRKNDHNHGAFTISRRIAAEQQVKIALSSHTSHSYPSKAEEVGTGTRLLSPPIDGQTVPSFPPSTGFYFPQDTTPYPTMSSITEFDSPDTSENHSEENVPHSFDELLTTPTLSLTGEKFSPYEATPYPTMSDVSDVDAGSKSNEVEDSPTIAPAEDIATNLPTSATSPDNDLGDSTTTSSATASHGPPVPTQYPSLAYYSENLLWSPSTTQYPTIALSDQSDTAATTTSENAPIVDSQQHLPPSKYPSMVNHDEKQVSPPTATQFPTMAFSDHSNTVDTTTTEDAPFVDSQQRFPPTQYPSMVYSNENSFWSPSTTQYPTMALSDQSDTTAIATSENAPLVDSQQHLPPTQYPSMAYSYENSLRSPSTTQYPTMPFLLENVDAMETITNSSSLPLTFIPSHEPDFSTNAPSMMSNNIVALDSNSFNPATQSSTSTLPNPVNSTSSPFVTSSDSPILPNNSVTESNDFIDASSQIPLMSITKSPGFVAAATDYPTLSYVDYSAVATSPVVSDMDDLTNNSNGFDIEKETGTTADPTESTILPSTYNPFLGYGKTNNPADFADESIDPIMRVTTSPSGTSIESGTENVEYPVNENEYTSENATISNAETPTADYNNTEDDNISTTKSSNHFHDSTVFPSISINENSSEDSVVSSGENENENSADTTVYQHEGFSDTFQHQDVQGGEKGQNFVDIIQKFTRNTASLIQSVYVVITAVILGVLLCFFCMVYQLLENPDGCFTTFCKSVVGSFRFVCCTCCGVCETEPDGDELVALNRSRRINGESK